MSAHDVKLFGDAIAASRLETRFAQVRATSLLRLAIEDLYPGRIALVSCFGADSAVLLHMVAQVDKATPVVFVDTGQHFPETLAYRDDLGRAPRAHQRRSSPSRTRRRLQRKTRRNSCSPAIPTAAAKSARSLRSPRRWTATTPGSPAAKASRARRARAAAVRGRGRAGQGQPAGRLERERHAGLYHARPICRRIRWSPRAFPRSAACPAPAPSSPAKTRARAAGAGEARPNAASNRPARRGTDI